MKNNTSPPGIQAKSAVRALDLLEALAADGTGRTFTQLGETLKIPKSSLFQLLAVLSDRGYVAMDPVSRRYRLGIRARELGQAYTEHQDLLTEALPALNGIVADFNETVQLSVLDGRENVYLAKVDCSHALRLQSSVGRRLPAYATGLGKALLANLPPEELARRVDGWHLQRFTPNTITDPAALLRVLAGANARRFAVDNEEYTVGVRCVAVPIYTDRGAVAAISTAIPSIRATWEQLATGLRLLAKHSLEISSRLGCPVEDARLSRLRDLEDHDVVTVLADAWTEAERAARTSSESASAIVGSESGTV